MAYIRLFEHSNITGRQLFIDHPVPQRYLLATSGFLNEMEFKNITSSVRLGASPTEVFNMCILFENDRFGGKFKVFAFNKNRDIISLPYFNDLTSSVLLLSHDPAPYRLILNIRQLAGNRINASIDKQLQDIPGVTRNGDVLLKFAIDVYEIGQFGNDLIKVEVPLKIHTIFPFNKYQARIGYYVDLFITNKQILKASVVGWWYWIEGGFFAGSIENRLRSHAKTGVPLIESELNMMLHEFNWHQWNDVYLLPGLTSNIDADYQGHIDDDCSIVLSYLE